MGTVTSPRQRWSGWARWPDPEDGPYWIGATWSGPDAELVGIEMWVRPPGSERVNPGPKGALIDIFGPTMASLGARSLRAPLARVLTRLRAESGLLLADEATHRRGRRREAALRAAEGLSRGNRSRYPIEHYRDVAALYANAAKYGKPIYEAIQLAMPASKSTVAHWITRCRALGLLPPAR